MSQQEQPKNSYRAKVWAEKIAQAKRLRVHPSREEEIRAMIDSIKEHVPHLAAPGGIIVEEHLDPGQVLIEHHAPDEQPDAYCETSPDGDCVSEDPRCMHQPGRNDPCPCGSGKKHKKCCGFAGGQA